LILEQIIPVQTIPCEPGLLYGGLYGPRPGFCLSSSPMRRAALAILIVLAATAARAGDTRCWFENGAVVVPAAFGDIAGDFILDASAPASQLHVTTAETFGVDGSSARARLRLAGERTGPLTLQVADLDARGKPFVTSIVGVIGADALAPFVVDIATDPCRVRLSRAARGAGAWRAPLRTIDGVPAVRAAISDGETSRAGWFAIDTGEAASGVAAARLSRTPAAGTDPPVRLRALSVAGLLFEQMPGGVQAEPRPGLAGAIGMAVWSRFRLRLDRKHGWLELTSPVSATAEPRGRASTGPATPLPEWRKAKSSGRGCP
jgi:hypothetical protein